MFELTTATAANSSSFNLEGMYQWGVSVIQAFQSVANPFLTIFARIFTFLGDPTAYILILPVLFWCMDEKRGFKIGMTVFISTGINIALKELFQVQRPFYRDPSVKMIDASGFSTPSGHSQGSATFWPLIAGTQPVSEGKKNMTLRLFVAIGLPFCIGLSRIYLGVHYPTDVLFGWTVGALIAVSVLFLPRTAIWKKSATSITAHTQSSGRSMRTFKLAGLALVALVLNAICGRDSSMGGVVFGFGAGYILLMESPVKFSATSGTLLKKALRLVVGLGVLALLYVGLKKVFPGEESAYYALFRFLRYGIIGFWASWGAPKLFIKTGLAS